MLNLSSTALHLSLSTTHYTTSTTAPPCPTPIYPNAQMRRWRPRPHYFHAPPHTHCNKGTAPTRGSVTSLRYAAISFGVRPHWCCGSHTSFQCRFMRLSASTATPRTYRFSSYSLSHFCRLYGRQFSPFFLVASFGYGHCSKLSQPSRSPTFSMRSARVWWCIAQP